MLRGARVVYIAAKSSSSIGYLLVPENGLKHFWAISLLNQYMYLMKFELCTFLSIMNTKVQRRRKAFPFPVGKTEAPSDGYPHDIRRFDIKGYACINLPISKAISGDYSIRWTDEWAAGTSVSSSILFLFLFISVIDYTESNILRPLMCDGGIWRDSPVYVESWIPM